MLADSAPLIISFLHRTFIVTNQRSIAAEELATRQALSESLQLPESALPFAGELLQVREEDKHWEGAVERVLHNFALSLLVPDEHYQLIFRFN